jgi:sensor histidine kinase YesM
LLSDNQETTVVPAPLRWWQHWWVLTLGALVAALFVWFIARRYEKHRARKALLRLQREKRQKDLQVNAIRLKAIPHFNANVLAGIEYYVMNNSADEATRYLKLYADFNNRVLVDIDRPARTVEEEVDDVRTYLELERLRYGDRLQYDITVDDDVDRNVLLPNMLLHTYCQNAIKHGITHKAEGGHIAVTIRKSVEDAGFIEVSVKDDGVGREEASRLNRDTTKQGLKILLEQVELFNQSNEQPISQHVTDLYDDEGKAAGTVFTMLIPLNFKYV